MTGLSAGINSGTDFATIAYSVKTGARLWVRRYNSPGNGYDAASSVVVGPGGLSVFVTGLSTGTTAGDQYATVAYTTATGAKQWVARYNGAPQATDGAHSVAVSPAGGRLFVTFVTGDQRGAGPVNDYATAAYSIATGAQLWVRRYSGPANRWDDPAAVAASPSGRTVIVTGFVTLASGAPAYGTVAYNAATGAQQWVRRYSGPGGNDAAASVSVSASGRKVFVTGASYGPRYASAYATIAYSTTTGAQLWVKRYSRPGNGYNIATAVAANPAKDVVFVTGETSIGNNPEGYTTIAYAG